MYTGIKYSCIFDSQSSDMEKFRIITADNKVKFAGTGSDSWFTLAKAEQVVNRENGEMVYEYTCPGGERLWEVM